MQGSERYLKEIVSEDALSAKKIAFISGPRQVGKTTLAKALAPPENYFSFDDETFRKAWTKNARDAIRARIPGPVVLDEVHKDRRWKTKLKGLFDTIGATLPLIVTGSVRLDLYRRGGDSLMGRYFPYRLHPYSVAERSTPPAPPEAFGETQAIGYPWSDLLHLGGFPEPLLAGNKSKAQRWSRLRLERLVYEDVRDLRNVSDVNAFRVAADPYQALLRPTHALQLVSKPGHDRRWPDSGVRVLDYERFFSNLV